VDGEAANSMREVPPLRRTERVGEASVETGVDGI